MEFVIIVSNGPLNNCTWFVSTLS